MSEHREGEALSEDLARIVIRADDLGFCTWRVATALRVTPRQLASISRRPDSQRSWQVADHSPSGASP